MVYINSDGTTSETRKRKWGLSIIRDFVVGIFDFVGIFFRTLTASPAALEAERGRRRTTYAQRQGVRRSGGGGGGGGGANVRGLNRCGTAKAAAGG
mmetsp:Transcript_38038/g.65007  ORF Transcript_38038/g.65007 Transcript_38038/m.65007 type:complete len:96 (-) Transcript_38038:118-405(-)|eukprot:CAMPEP_0183720418 /NCGR_PEP_ID=MMETSP0737-20130205/13033_1 /TAXON_ID=385413 /ORGANISM="Thalassiosira miniscula, Strain CCMP1093" /LENGTH=95 /DNA_ID=CAMNT_0025950275 /DNA_START=196 /DNA_END=483 /DNA_ORIENTATION=+